MSNECVYCMNDIPFEMPDEIIEAAKCGNLVLFCGAGISTENKNVLPFSFYKSICEELDVSDDISFSELMQKYCELPNGRRKLIKKIRERFQYINSFSEIKRQATAFHKELSEIHQIKTIITTNWDTYFEEYCGASSITIPEDFTLWDEHLRHVIKIHGSMSNIGSIIATTKDYEKCYLSLQNGIIGATLKNLLATKTVVFIGFSFGDEDFDQILKYLCDEMGDLFPHIYTVSLDKSLKDKLDYGKTSTPFSDDERDLGNMPKEEFLLALQNSVKLTLPYIKFRGYVLVFIKDFQPDKKEINMLHAEVASILNEIPELNYKGMKIWADKSTKPYPYGYPFSFVANQIHQYILIFRKEK